MQLWEASRMQGGAEFFSQSPILWLVESYSDLRKRYLGRSVVVTAGDGETRRTANAWRCLLLVPALRVACLFGAMF